MKHGISGIELDRDKGRFPKGYTWRNPKPYWNKEWLECEYIDKDKSARQIAQEQECHENNILYFLQKHNIKRKTIKEIRSRKKWGLSGEKNGMYGRTGNLNPNWNGGHSAERQTMYARSVWKNIIKSVLKRDNYECCYCNSVKSKDRKIVVHHIKAWSRYPELRFEETNLITLCEVCHRKEHGKH